MRRRDDKRKGPRDPPKAKERHPSDNDREGLISRARREARDRSEAKEYQRTAQKRAMHEERWKDICKDITPGTYTTDHPVVGLEYKMCEYRFLALFMNKNRDLAFQELTDAEKDVYLNGYPALGIGPYTSVEEGSFVRAAYNGVVRYRKINVELVEAHQKK